MIKYLITLGMLTALSAAPETAAKDCCPSGEHCCKDTCCKAADNCCKAVPRKACTKECKKEEGMKMDS